MPWVVSHNKRLSMFLHSFNTKYFYLIWTIIRFEGCYIFFTVTINIKLSNIMSILCTFSCSFFRFFIFPFQIYIYLLKQITKSNWNFLKFWFMKKTNIHDETDATIWGRTYRLLWQKQTLYVEITIKKQKSKYFQAGK